MRKVNIEKVTISKKKGKRDKERETLSERERKNIEIKNIETGIKRVWTRKKKILEEGREKY